MKGMRRLLALALAAMLALAFPACADISECPPVGTSVRDIMKYGNLILDISGNALLELGYEYGDLVAATIGDTVLDLPVCGDYSDVDVGAPVCRVIQADSSDDSYAILAINGSDLATKLGLATRVSIDEDPGFRWDYAEAWANGIPITLSLEQKGGYLEQLKLHQLQMTNAREDYPDLTDAQYANFRNVTTTGMGANALYRSSSPVNPEYNRNHEADAAVNAAGIRTVLNLADNEVVMKGFEGYAQTYYSQLDVVPMDLIVDFTADSFKEGLAKGLRFLADHEGPYLVHCTMGKDRAGFVSAVLECLMGASAEEIVADFMVSYYNYYGIGPDSDTYEAVANSNIRKTLAQAFGIDDIASADLGACAEEYLLDIGLTGDEIAAVKARLGTDIK